MCVGSRPMPSDPISVDGLAVWSPWIPMADAVATAPLAPGVYMAREGATGPVVYVGMAGERRGRGLRGRLTVYRRGKGMVSGLGEAAMDRALADPAWLRVRLEEVQSGHGGRGGPRTGLGSRWSAPGFTSGGRPCPTGPRPSHWSVRCSLRSPTQSCGTGLADVASDARPGRGLNVSTSEGRARPAHRAHTATLAQSPHWACLSSSLSGVRVVSRGRVRDARTPCLEHVRAPWSGPNA
jgi:hypothetical protein